MQQRRTSEPLMRANGRRAGNTEGSFCCPSNVSFQSTVSKSISLSNAAVVACCNLHSVYLRHSNLSACSQHLSRLLLNNELLYHCGVIAHQAATVHAFPLRAIACTSRRGKAAYLDLKTGHKFPSRHMTSRPLRDVASFPLC